MIPTSSTPIQGNYEIVRERVQLHRHRPQILHCNYQYSRPVHHKLKTKSTLLREQEDVKKLASGVK